jgi:ribosome biogenesis GTPase A
VAGRPNVGKSTLINTLLGKRSTKTGDEAGVTKVEQRLTLASDFYLFDTPGMLWPKIVVEESGYLLAASGAVGRNALDEEEVAMELIKFLCPTYNDLLIERYKVDADALSTLNEGELLELIGRKRGAVLGGGRVNLQKAAEIVLYEFRQAKLGRITLETPEQFLAWTAEGERQEAEREEARVHRKAVRQGKVNKGGKGPRELEDWEVADDE